MSYSERDGDCRIAFDVECVELVQSVCDVRPFRGEPIFPRGVYVGETKIRSCSV